MVTTLYAEEKFNDLIKVLRGTAHAFASMGSIMSIKISRYLNQKANQSHAGAISVDSGGSFVQQTRFEAYPFAVRMRMLELLLEVLILQLETQQPIK
jgi:hypothetical protein